MEVAFHFLQWKGIETPSLTIFLFDISEPNSTSKPRYFSLLSGEKVFSQPIAPMTHFSFSIKKLCVSTSRNTAPSDYPTGALCTLLLHRLFFFSNQSLQGTQSWSVLGSSAVQPCSVVPGEVGWQRKLARALLNLTFLSVIWVGLFPFNALKG